MTVIGTKDRMAVGSISIMLLENLTVKEVMRYRTDPESGHLFHSRSEKVKVDIGLMIWVEIGTLYLMRRSMMAKLALVTGLRI